MKGPKAVPDDLQDTIQLVPVRHDNPAIDDLFTIALAFEHRCHYVDNDNYSDWITGQR